MPSEELIQKQIVNEALWMAEGDSGLGLTSQSFFRSNVDDAGRIPGMPHVFSIDREVKF